MRRRKPGPRSMAALRLDAMIENPGREFDRALLRLALAKEPHLPSLRLLMKRAARYTTGPVAMMLRRMR